MDPRPGTPLADETLLSPREALQAIALFRLVLPSAWLRLAGGRERVLGELQAMGVLAGANALIVGNYLTTAGRAPDEDLALLDACWACRSPMAPARAGSSSTGPARTHDRRVPRSRSASTDSSGAVRRLVEGHEHRARRARPEARDRREIKAEPPGELVGETERTEDDRLDG